MSERRDDVSPRDPFFRELSVPLLAHELKGPLAVIEAGVRSLLDRGEGDPARNERTLRRVLRGALRAQALVDDLLEVGRAQAGQLDRVTFRPGEAVVDGIVSAVEAMDAELGDRIADQTGAALAAALLAGGVELSISDRAHQAVMVGDERKLRLVVANLLRNALRFRRNLIRVGVDTVTAMLRVSVEDDGPGVARADRERIFERWARGAGEDSSGSRQGHGLGLAAARILARELGGDVTLEGEDGSRFLFTLPLSSP
jgi:signal transduction histidine kinase